MRYLVEPFTVDNTQAQVGFVVNHDITDPQEAINLIRQNIDVQRDLIAEIANNNGIGFLDMTPFLIEEVSQGNAMYFANDTHLNQSGNDVLYDVVHSFMENLDSR